MPLLYVFVYLICNMCVNQSRICLFPHKHLCKKKSLWLVSVHSCGFPHSSSDSLTVCRSAHTMAVRLLLWTLMGTESLITCLLLHQCSLVEVGKEAKCTSTALPTR